MERARQEQRRLTPEYQKYHREYMRTQKHRDYMREFRHRTKFSRVPQLMFIAAQTRARMYDLPFSITISDIIVPEICPVLGIPLIKGREGRATANSPSLDRIVPERGYVPGNVRVISWRANSLKKDATIAELEAVLRYMRSEDT